MSSPERFDPERVRTEIRLIDLEPAFRTALQDARTGNGWDQAKVGRIVAHAYDFLGPFVSAHIERGSSHLGEPHEECLVMEFHPPSGRDLGAAEETYQRACELANTGNLRGALAPLQEIVRDFPEV